MENKKNYYAVIPAEVRYAKNLKANEKLMYGELTALANEKGIVTPQMNILQIFIRFQNLLFQDGFLI